MNNVFTRPRWFRVFVGILGVSLATAQADSEPFEKPTLVLGTGEQRLLRVSDLERFSLGSPVVRALSPGKGLRKDRLLIKAISPGTSDLWVWKKGGSAEHRRIQVAATSPDPINPDLQKALSRLEETEIIYSGQGVILSGLVESSAEAARCSAIARFFPKEVSDETVLSPRLLAQGQSELQKWIDHSRYQKRLRLEPRSRTLWVIGDLESPAEVSDLERRLRAIFPPVKTEIDALPDHAPTVHFKVFLLELRKSRFRTLGLSWPALQENAFHVTTGGVQDLVGLDLALQALEGDGSAKILSSPELVVRAPGEAELFSGGELPIHMESHFYSNVTWKPFGLTLKLKVTQSAGDRVRLEVSTEVSHLDPTLMQDKIPGLQANRMKTQVDARYGVPLLLSGLLQQGTRENAKGIPLLRDIPVLGKLFGSEDYLNERSELVAVLLPTLAPPDPPMERFARLTPLGHAPPPRNWVPPKEERALRGSNDFPWNAVQ